MTPLHDILTTDRLYLRDLSVDDLDEVAAMLADPGVMRFWPRPLTREEAAGWIDKQIARYEHDGCGYWLALRRTTGEVVGQLGVLMCEFDGRREPSLGYILNTRWWGRGLATEGAAACMRWAFRHFDAPRVTSLVRPENGPSRRVAERIGMAIAGETLFADVSHLVYALNREHAR